MEFTSRCRAPTMGKCVILFEEFDCFKNGHLLIVNVRFHFFYKKKVRVSRILQDRALFAKYPPIVSINAR